MQKKAKLLIVFNILFYIFICVHKSYLDDDIAQFLFYMALLFSANVLEETFRNKINELKVYSLIDFSLRIGVLIVHFVTIILNMNLSKMYLITGILFIANILIEGIIVYRVKNMKGYEFEIVKQKNLDNFVNDFYSKKLDYYAMGTDLKKEIVDIMKFIEISGKSTIVIIILLIFLFISRFVYDHFIQLIYISIVLVILLLFFLLRLSYLLDDFIYSNNEYRKEKNVIQTITFIVGYSILFVNEVIFYKRAGLFYVSISILAASFFIPMFNTKYIVRMRLINIYKKYKKVHYIER